MKKYSKKLLQHLYRTMLRIRLCEESFVDPILNGEVRCPCHLYSGEEAIAVGICSVLSEADYWPKAVAWLSLQQKSTAGKQVVPVAEEGRCTLLILTKG